VQLSSPAARTTFTTTHLQQHARLRRAHHLQHRVDADALARKLQQAQAGERLGRGIGVQLEDLQWAVQLFGSGSEGQGQDHPKL
jgi:hypothetical protein